MTRYYVIDDFDNILCQSNSYEFCVQFCVSEDVSLSCIESHDYSVLR